MCALGYMLCDVRCAMRAFQLPVGTVQLSKNRHLGLLCCMWVYLASRISRVYVTVTSSLFRVPCTMHLTTNKIRILSYELLRGFIHIPHL